MTQPFDLAVVGGGPRALSALVALDDALARTAGGPVTVLVLDPAAPGAGRVWDPTQPEHLLMNVDADIVDMSGAAVPLSYRAWERAEGFAAERFPPRARLGAHLAWCWAQLLDSPRLRIEHLPVEVADVRRSDSWEVVASDGAVWTAAEVLLATGHARVPGGTGPDHAALADGGFAGRPVRVMGAALTALDVVRDLTVGAESSWPERIEVRSRSGELLVPKPDFLPPDLRPAVLDVVAAWPDSAQPDEGWWEVLLDAALAAARACGRSLDLDAARATLEAGRHPSDPVERLRGDVRRAAGEVDDDPAWWLGRAWSAGYAEVVRSLERAERTPETWSVFRERAARLERWAFGPPLATARQVLALADAGRLVVRVGEADASGIDVDARTAPAGVVGAAATPLWSSLLQRGTVHVRPGERGVLTAPDGHCLSASGEVVEGLSALGRPTEDPVVGHDTLSRSLHGDARRWAEALAHRCTTHARRLDRAVEAL